MNIEEIQNLLRKYASRECSQEEKQLVERWYERLYNSGVVPEEEDINVAMGKKQEELLQQVSAESKSPQNVRLMFRKFKAVAAAVLLLITLAGYFYVNSPASETHIVRTANDRPAPQKNTATIILSNGETVYLDSTHTGVVVQQGSVRMIKGADGEISYERADGEPSGEILYNTLTNPRGSRVIELMLEDGSRVWLNAGSAITYPVLFAADFRTVSVEGEAYFEVKAEKKRKFQVYSNETTVEVLGTKFNVNTFRDDSRENKITLLEGSIRVNAAQGTKLLKPGQQAQVDENIEVVNEVDLEEVMAWKNGYFTFNNARLQLVLSQIARWYDVDVVYEGQPEAREFYGDIQRDLNLSEILKLLEKNGVQFELKDNKLIVKPLKKTGM